MRYFPQAEEYTFSHRELAEILIRTQGIHEGLWGIHVEFTLGAANVGQPGSTELIPAAIVPIKAIGIHRYEEPNNLTIDASQVNPAVAEGKIPRRKK